jgi:PAS domain S-box-containing protein
MKMNGTSDMRTHEAGIHREARVGVDVTAIERTRADEVNSPYAAMVESAFDGIVTASLDGMIHTWNPACERLFGYDCNDVIGRSLRMLAPPDRLAEQIGAFQRLAAGETVNLETRCVRRDGSLVDVLLNLAPIRDRHGQIATFVATIHDVSDRTRAHRQIKDGQTELIESQERSRRQLAELQRIYDAAPIGLAVLSADLRYLRVNLCFAEMNGLGVEDYIGRTIYEIFPGGTDGIAAHARRLRENRGILYFEVADATRTATRTRIWGVTWLPLKSESGEVDGINMVVRDITLVRAEIDDVNRVAELLEERVIERTRALEQEMREKHQAQTILFQLQKIEATGHLTSGIAHDFNNMLGVISVNISSLTHRLAPEDIALKRLAENAMKGVERAAALTRQLLAFARPQPPDATSLDVNLLILGIRELLERTLGEKVTVEAMLMDGLWPALADANQLENALLNLAVNARDAMPDGGRLTMKTENAALDEAYAAAHPDAMAGEYLAITITDTGVGMPPEVVALAFEPFFTTKEAGHGSGLGLSQVYGFIKQSGGHVSIVSTPRVGTAVTLYLPRFAIAPGMDPPAAEAVELLPAGPAPETILVVEDNDDLRAGTVGMLLDLGYRVLADADGQAALQTLDRTPDIDLLFTDIGLPGKLSGHMLADAARIRNPGLKVLLTSGYAWEVPMKSGSTTEAAEVLPKPFTYAGLARKIRQTLECVPARAGPPPSPVPLGRRA